MNFFEGTVVRRDSGLSVPAFGDGRQLGVESAEAGPTLEEFSR